jgi:hypothetical protein
MERFTAYRRKMSERATHNSLQKNPDDQPQYDGVIFDDGKVVIHWRTSVRSTSVFDSLAEMIAIHGHPEYGTEIIFHDGPMPAEWATALQAYEDSLQSAECNGH